MNKPKIRKWEWIRDYCIQRGFTKSAETADQIDRVLCYAYGDTDTLRWKDFIEGEDGKELMATDRTVVYTEIVQNEEFCIACLFSKRCTDCKFRNLVGSCGDPHSLFGAFEESFFDEERGEIIE